MFFSSDYLVRGIALYGSLQANEHDPFKLWIMCMDQGSFDSLQAAKLCNTELIQLSELESADPALHEIKPKRTLFEYYASCKSALMLYLIKKNAEIERITYLDADLFFFNDPRLLREQFKNSSVAITAHRFKLDIQRSETRGIYNAGWLSIKADTEGIRCLEWWKTKCIEWCKDYVEDGKYADQKYIDSFPALFSNVMVVQDIGANVGPWNIRGSSINSDGKTVFIDGAPIIFYHFHGLRRVRRQLFDAGTTNYRASVTANLNKFVYKPYLVALNSVEKDYPDFAKSVNPRRNLTQNKNWLSSLIHEVLRIGKRMLFRAYIKNNIR